MARTLKSDKALFIAALLLVCAGVLMVYSASAIVAEQRFDRASLYVMKQSLWVLLGLVVLGVAMRVDYRLYRTDLAVWSLVAFVWLLLVLVLFSTPVNGARRWLDMGPLTFQPAELAKISVVLMAALVLERRMHRIDDVRYSLLPLALALGPMVGLILLQPDYGTAVSLLLIAGIMVFAAGLSYRYLIGAMAVAIPVLYLVLVSAPYRRRRLITFLDPEADRLGDGFQLTQSLIAIGTGGISGLGFMHGVRKLFYLPEPHTDFIFAVIGEELGLIGTTAILVCFAIIAWRGLRIATRAEDAFGAFVALGLTSMIAAQAMMNMSVVLGLLPTKGMPLPLVSAGGSSLLISLLGVGILLNISQHQTVQS